MFLVSMQKFTKIFTRIANVAILCEFIKAIFTQVVNNVLFFLGVCMENKVFVLASIGDVKIIPHEIRYIKGSMS